MDGPKPYKFIWCEAMDGHKPCKIQLLLDQGWSPTR
jgi:hypothetical protein